MMRESAGLAAPTAVIADQLLNPSPSALIPRWYYTRVAMATISAARPTNRGFILPTVQWDSVLQATPVSESSIGASSTTASTSAVTGIATSANTESSSAQSTTTQSTTIQITTTQSTSVGTSATPTISSGSAGSNGWFAGVTIKDQEIHQVQDKTPEKTFSRPAKNGRFHSSPILLLTVSPETQVKLQASPHASVTQLEGKATSRLALAAELFDPAVPSSRTVQIKSLPSQGDASVLNMPPNMMSYW
ncbi:hypothetical protein G7Y89_g1489 [Cudoniella acicularis]|uniref:Uncharacterized protein n=1 Tax=Cudoniella acicularis TaxID=354080 RepID=A0A8H4W7D2_9HELO|nr:hypothetical protein G7Y89_g1489 [Cudoniella acicularis]